MPTRGPPNRSCTRLWASMLRSSAKAKARRASFASATRPSISSRMSATGCCGGRSTSASRLGGGEKLLGAEQRLEGNAGLGIELGGAFAAVEDRQHESNFRARLGDCPDSIHGRGARCGYVLENDDGLAGNVRAVDALFRAVILDRLSDEKPRKTAPELRTPHGDRRNQRHRSHLQAPDAVCRNS